MSSLHTLIGLCYSVTALFTCQDTGNADPFGSLLSIGLDGVCILEIPLAANVHVAVERLMKLVSQLTWKVRRWNVAYHIHITYFLADFYGRRWRRRLVALLQATFYQTGDHSWSCVFLGYHGTFPAVSATTKTGYLYGKSDQLESVGTFPPVYLVTKLGVFLKTDMLLTCLWRPKPVF